MPNPEQAALHDEFVRQLGLPDGIAALHEQLHAIGAAVELLEFSVRLEPALERALAEETLVAARLTAAVVNRLVGAVGRVGAK